MTALEDQVLTAWLRRDRHQSNYSNILRIANAFNIEEVEVVAILMKLNAYGS